MATTTGQWESYNAVVTLIPGTEYNNKATGSWQTSGALLDNGTNKDQLCDIEFTIATTVSAGGGTPRLDIYIVRAPNGTTAMLPPGIVATATPGSYFVGSILANVSSVFLSGVLAGVVLPAGKFVVTTQQNLGATTPAVNTATLWAYPYNDVGVTV